MALRLFNLFCLLFLILQATANPILPEAAPTVYVPDFSGQAFVVPEGAFVNPLCTNPADASCISEWAHQATPFSVQQNLGMGDLKQFQYFLPVFIPSRIMSEDPRESSDWIPYTPSRRYSGGIKERGFRGRARPGKKARDKDTEKKAGKDEVQRVKERPFDGQDRVPEVEERPGRMETEVPKPPEEEDQPMYYIHKEDSSKVATVDVAPDGSVQITRGRVAFMSPEVIEPIIPDAIPAPAVSEPPQAEPLTDERAETPLREREPAPPDDGPGGTTPQKKTDKSPRKRKAAVPPDDGLRGATPRTRPAEPSRTRREAAPPDDGPQGATSQARPVEPPSEEPIKRLPMYRVNQDAIALPATIKEIQPDCFVIDKPELKTEAGFCFECRRGKGDPALAEMAKDAEMVRDLNEGIQNVDQKNVDRQASKSLNIGEEGVSSLQICSPETPLEEIIKKFENTCPAPYKKDFEKFAKKSTCESCKKGVAPEIMLAMMSIESVGDCEAVGTMNKKKKERSVGLFQVDSTQHQCLGNKKGSPGNLQCLKDPVNNLSMGINILIKHYGDVSPNRCLNSRERERNQQLQCQLKPLCKNWLKMDPKERDSWRRTVSAYNGGSGWIRRAKYAASNVHKTLKGTDYLQFTHDFKTYGQCRGIKNCIGKGSTHCNRMRRKYRGLALRQVFQNCMGMVDFINNKGDPVNWDIDWETLRAYYFLEKLSPGNKSDSGRQMRWTESNLAHTEAVLGREIKNGKASHGMVEVWAEYIRKNKLKLECSEL